MKRTLKQNLRNLSSGEFEALKLMSHLSKNLYNRTLYEVRQYFFDNGEYLNYYNAYKRVKSNENYELLPSQPAQQTMKHVDKAFKSFFKLVQKKREGKYDNQANIPRYLPKDGHYTLSFPSQSFQIKEDHIRVGVPKQMREEFDLDVKEIQIPFTYEEFKKHDVKQLKIIPKAGGQRFEYCLVYDVDQKDSDVDKDKFLSMDLGVNNLATCVDQSGRSFILDGRELKSVNRLANKKLARLKAVKDKQGIDRKTKRMDRIYQYRDNRMHDYLNKAVYAIIQYCLDHDIGTVFVGDASGWKQNVNLGDSNNQNFVQIPFDKIKQKLKGKCELYGIEFVLVDESYTSKASFFDDDGFNPETEFSGNRIHRGLYEIASGETVNADVNSALNIARKGKQNSNFELEDCVASDVDSPMRIREPFKVKIGHCA